VSSSSLPYLGDLLDKEYISYRIGIWGAVFLCTPENQTTSNDKKSKQQQQQQQQNSTQYFLKK